MGEPDNRNIKISFEFLGKLQKDIATLRAELRDDQFVVRLRNAKDPKNEEAKLQAGNPGWGAAALLVERYQGPSGTVPTLNAAVDWLDARLKSIDDHIYLVRKEAMLVEGENFKIANELRPDQVARIFRPEAPKPDPGAGS